MPFPTNPAQFQAHTENSILYYFNGSAWDRIGQSISAWGNSRINQIRMGISTSVVHSELILSSSKLYIHPFEGSSISLFDTQTGTWRIHELPQTLLEFNVTTIVPDRVHDVYLYRDVASGTWSVEFLTWSDNTTAPARQWLNGVQVRVNFPQRKFIGIILTSSVNQNRIENRYGSVALTNLNAVEQSPRQGFCNMYNRLRHSYVMKFADQMSENTTSNWRFAPGYGSNAKFNVLNINESHVDVDFTLYVSPATTGVFKASIGLNGTNPSAFSGLISRVGSGEFLGSSHYNGNLSSPGTSQVYYLVNTSSVSAFNELPGVSGFTATVSQ